MPGTVAATPPRQDVHASERTAPRGARLSYVYILGAGHSGSTLLAMLLGRHPRICTLGEAKAPAVGSRAAYRCSCGRSITECGFWRALAEQVGGAAGGMGLLSGGGDIRRAPTAYTRTMLRPLHRSAFAERLRDAALWLAPAWRGHLARVQHCNAAVARAACATSGKDVFVDSSKTGLQVKYLLRNPALDVRVIRLVRDGRGVTLSYRDADAMSIADAAYEWRRSNEEAEAVVAQLRPDSWFDLRYEQLCAALEPTLKAVCEFIGVVAVQPLGADGCVQHVLGNDRARLNPSEVRLDERWRRTLTDDHLRTFDRIAGRLNRRLGYS